MKENIFLFFTHLEFLRWFAKSKPKEKMLEFYDRSFGRINDTMSSQLAECCYSVIDVMDVLQSSSGSNCIQVFYKTLGLPCPSLSAFVSFIQKIRETRYLPA
eukprot:TRINITY_DN2981_c0_g1_i2.p1 TRINITY_DN2981_c0_g1~~TRINITY_DN2981_c0_g1_i2.p1  ORF type:complete len:102 (-),score=28.73 TRINITY_DN2981_c0_g1_i2:29-334(-)